MKHISLPALALVCVLALLAAAPAQASSPSPAESALLRAVNQARAARSLRPLVLSTTLQTGARSFASRILTEQSFEHGSIRPGVAENRFWGTRGASSARAIVRAWLAHGAARANLLSPRIRRIGIGIVEGRFLGASGAVVAVARFSR